MKKYLSISFTGLFAATMLLASAPSAFAAQVALTTGLNVTAVDSTTTVGGTISVQSNAVPTAAVTVSSNDDLNSYVAASMKSDANIRHIAFSGNAVRVDYRGTGRLFGFIPVSITTTATANVNGTVTVTHPWYDFLIAKDDADLQGNLSTSVGGMNAGAGGQWSYATQAHIADEMRQDLSAQASVNQ